MLAALRFLTVAEIRGPCHDEAAEFSRDEARRQALPSEGAAGPFSDTIFRCHSVEVLGEIEDGPQRALRRRKSWDQQLADF